MSLPRRDFLQQISLLSAGLTLSGLPWLSSCQSSAPSTIMDLLQAAGSARHESERLSLLTNLLAEPSLPTDWQEPLAVLKEFSEQMVNGPERFEATPPEDRPKRYLSNFFKKIDLETKVGPTLAATAPLAPLAAWYRARFLCAMLLEQGGILGNEKILNAYLNEIESLIQQASTAYPDNPVMGMYLHRPIAWEASTPPLAKAPEWAQLQRETLEKVSHVIRWWVTERQVSDGQFGGGWGDDVEMWRDWMPVLIAFDDPEIVAGQTRMAEGLYATKAMKDGFTDRVYDVEHVAEDSADTCTSMMHLRRGDPTWEARALRLVELMETLWAGRNERGQLQFKSTYFSVDTVDPDPRKACDTVYHPRTIQPALLYWQRTGDERIGRLVSDWMDTWVEATARAEKGKPAGVIPSAIHWPDGGIGGLTEQWWDPGNHDEDPLYVWPSAMRMMVNVLLQTHFQIGEVRYLEPLISMAAMYRRHLQGAYPTEAAMGSEAWCAEQMGRFLPDVLAKYRILSGDSQFDDLIEAGASGYARFRIGGEAGAVLADLQRNQQALAWNEIAFTEEVLWTDRIFAFHNNYYNQRAEQPIPNFDSDSLFSMLTGNVGNALYFPLNAVRWLTPPTDIAIWVKRADSQELEVELFHFGEQSRSLTAECYLLTPGAYQLDLQGPSGELRKESLPLGTSPQQFTIELPAQQLCTLRLKVQG